MKQRFSSLDVKVIAHELSESLAGLRLSNIHDLSSKIFLFKFSKPGDKKQMILDAGFRCHLTSFSRTTATSPSAFVLRLRKVLQTRRVTAVGQIGTDRIIEFQFSEGSYRLFLEFYAGGNIVLTDKELNILALQRVVAEGEGQEELRIGLKYVLENKQNYHGIPEVTKERLKAALQQAVDAENNPANNKKIKRKGGDALRKALAVSIPEYPPILIDHSLFALGFPSQLKPAEVLESDELLDQLILVLEEAQKVIEATMGAAPKGYIIAKKGTPTDASADASAEPPAVYDDFHPYKPKQFENDDRLKIFEFEGYNHTVDEFFSSIEGQKLESQLQERELNAKRKLESARADQQRRIGDLQNAQQINIRKAGAIEANVERVQEAMDAVNGLIAQGMDWVEIEKLVEMEQKRQNPVAMTIKLPLKLHENTITLLLGEQENIDDNDDDETDETDSEDSDSEDEQKPRKIEDTRLAIDINLSLTPWSNAGEYYSQKRSAAEKEHKTIQSSEKALKNTEQKIEAALKKAKAQEKPTLRATRQPLWFEKFIWFISSDGYLVLGGRDIQQNEMLYRKHLRKGDVYCHADMPGACSVVIRNNSATPDAPIPPSTLSQAGTMSVSTSTAWDSKALMAAWWVDADQVSKSAPTGGFLPVGQFSVQGKKNYLPPSQLLLGFGVIFRISDSSKASHTKHRVVDDIPAISADDLADQSKVEETSEKNTEETTHEDAESSDEEDAKSVRQNPLQSSGNAAPEDDEESSREDTVGSAGEETSGNDTPDIEKLQISEATPEDKSREPAEDAEQSSKVNDEAESEDDQHAKHSQKQGQKSKNAPKQKGPAPAKRGQRGKAKKMAAKYRDQDEEDRLAAEKLIGAKAGQERAQAEAKAKAEREAAAAAQKERRRLQHERALQETAEHEEKRKRVLEEGLDYQDEEEPTMDIPLDAFVGRPMPGDEILEAIPMCAPWSAMAKVKYKVKLQPGTQKKGKAVKEIVGRWQSVMESPKIKIDYSCQDRERIWPAEAQLIKAWKAEEVINTVPVSKVRIMVAGGMDGSSASKGAPGRNKGGKGGKKR